jgi:hypothetical protein
MKEVVSALRQQPSSMVEFSDVSRTSLWHRLTARMRSWFEIPYGYEDEKGFHYGVEPVPPKAAAQTAIQPKVFTDRASDVIPSPCPVSLNEEESSVEDHH